MCLPCGHLSVAQPGSCSCTNCTSGTYVSGDKSYCVKCPSGSTTGNRGGAQLSDCKPCQTGTYLPTQDAETCVPCPAGTYCDQMSMTLPMNCPYGTHNDATGQTKCYSCHPPARCLGGSHCAIGYRGALCGSCDVSFYMDRNLCIECPEVPALLIVFLVFVMIGLLLLVSLKIKPVWLIRARLVIAFVQTFTLSLSINIQWPPFIEWLKKVLSIFYLDVKLASPECLFTSYSWYTRYWLVLACASFIPVLLLLGVMTMHLVRKSLHAARSKWNLYLTTTKIQVRISRTIFVVVTMMYVPVTKMAIVPFVCVRSSDKTWVLEDDTSVLCTTAQHHAIQIVSAFILVFVTILGPFAISLLTLYDVYIDGNADVNSDTVFLKSRVSQPFRCREYFRCVVWILAYPLFILSGAWVILLFKQAMKQSDSQRREGYRRLDRRQVLSVLFESYHPQYSYFEAIVWIRKAVFTAVVAAGSSYSQSITFVVISMAYVSIVIYFRPFVPLPILSSRRQRFMVQLLNWMESVSSISVLLVNIMAIIMAFSVDGGKLPVLQIVSSIVVAMAGVSATVILALPILVKHEKVKSSAEETFNDRSKVNLFTTLNIEACIPQKYRIKRPDVELSDPKSLLGWGDGLYLDHLEITRRRVLEDDNMYIHDKLDLGEACTVWIGRLVGRLESRLDLLAVFHPEIPRTPRTELLRIGNNRDTIRLEDLSNRRERTSMVVRIGGAGADVHVEQHGKQYRAVYAYKSEKDGDLELAEGDIVIRVDERDGNGWWKGERSDGVVGWFPGEYVEERSEVGL